MSRNESWQKAEIPGPIKAFTIDKPRNLALLIKRSKRTLIIVGHRIVKVKPGNLDLVDFLVDLAQIIGAHIVVTGSLIRDFRARGYDDVYSMPIVEIADRLNDPEWKGFDGGGNYSLAIFIGLPYYFEWLVLSNLKHYAYKRLKTISLDPFYQPNAVWTLPNMSIDEWYKYLDSLKIALGER